MKFSFNRKELITVLFSLVIFLLILNIALSKIFKHSGSQIERIDLYSGEINDRFIPGLHNFGIKDEWIAENKNDIKSGDSLRFSYKVKVPKDLPIALLLNEISNSFQPGEITSVSRENKVNGTTNLFLSSGGFDKLKAEFVYDPEISRTSCAFGFLVYGITKLSPEMQDQLIKTPELFTAALVPSKESLEIMKKLKMNEKNFTVILNNDITDLDYKLSGSYSNERIKLSVRSILGDFSNALAYLFYGNSDFTGQSNFAFINKEFEKRKVKFININKFDMIDERETPLEVSFEQIVNHADENKADLIFISAENYLKLKPLILKYRKVGYKFINPSSVLSEYLNQQ
jgi:hypothetical protein